MGVVTSQHSDHQNVWRLRPHPLHRPRHRHCGRVHQLRQVTCRVSYIDSRMRVNVNQDCSPESREALTQDGCITAHDFQGAGPDCLPRFVLHHELVHCLLHLHHDAALRRLLGRQECVRETASRAQMVERGHGDRGAGLEVSLTDHMLISDIPEYFLKIRVLDTRGASPGPGWRGYCVLDSAHR